MKVASAEIVLKWEDGRTAKMGTIDIEADRESPKYKQTFGWRQRIGWELVREGFRIMLPSRKWKTEIGKGDKDDQD